MSDDATQDDLGLDDEPALPDEDLLDKEITGLDPQTEVLDDNPDDDVVYNDGVDLTADGTNDVQRPSAGIVPDPVEG